MAIFFKVLSNIVKILQKGARLPHRMWLQEQTLDEKHGAADTLLAGLGSGNSVAVWMVDSRGIRNTALICLAAGNRPAFYNQKTL